MQPSRENEIKYKELNRQLQAAFKEVLRLSREMIKLKSSDTAAKQGLVRRTESGQKQQKGKI
jgi:hypothetical protein